MKKFILSLFVSIIGFIGFSNAGTLTNCSGVLGYGEGYLPNYGTCTPSSVSISSLPFNQDGYLEIFITSNIIDVCDKGNGEDCSVIIGFYDSYDNMNINEVKYDLNCTNNEGCTDTILLNSFDYPDGIIYFDISTFGVDSSFNSINKSVNVILSYNESDNPGEGGNTGGLVVGGISEFTPIITGLKSAIIEFIPYVVYVGVGLISAILGFFAVKRLINWTRRKTLTNFTSRRLRK